MPMVQNTDVIVTQIRVAHGSGRTRIGSGFGWIAVFTKIGRPDFVNIFDIWGNLASYGGQGQNIFINDSSGRIRYSFLWLGQKKMDA